MTPVLRSRLHELARHVTWEQLPSGAILVMTRGRDAGLCTDDPAAILAWLDARHPGPHQLTLA